ncbi:hypothetical protein IFM89_012470, partial [Coptis chinensis]
YPVVDIVEDENIEDRGLGLENLVDACYGVHEGVRGDMYEGDTDQTSDFEQPFVPKPDLGKKYAEYKSKAEEKLYPSCEGPVTTLSAVVELHDLKKQYSKHFNGEQELNLPPSRLKGTEIDKLLSRVKYVPAGGNTLRSNNGKLPIIVHPDGRVIGVYSAKWSSRVGYWIRAVVPISYASWDKVDDSFKAEVWLKLMEEFQLNVNPTMGVRKNIEKWFAPKFRYWKYALREELVEQESSSKSKLEDELAEVKSTVGNLLAGQTRMENMMAGILEHVRLNGSANGQPSTPTTEVDSTSVPVPRTQQAPNLINRNGSLNPPSRLISYPNVKILGRKCEHVANGKLVRRPVRLHLREMYFLHFQVYHMDSTVNAACEKFLSLRKGTKMDIATMLEEVNPHTHQLKICDFGSAEKLVPGEPNISYICSRYYRAPELIFGATKYTTTIDMWSVGCVLAKLLLGQVCVLTDLIKKKCKKVVSFLLCIACNLVRNINFNGNLMD